MVLTLFSEILPVHGVEVLGPLPAEYKTDIRFAAAASATSKHADAVKALFDYLAGPKAEPVLKAKGIERR
jgi:molybdate transport system substrate-binding protein